MTAQELYEELRAALDYLGVGFRGMNDAQVVLVGSKLVFRADGRECSVELPVKEQS